MKRSKQAVGLSSWTLLPEPLRSQVGNALAFGLAFGGPTGSYGIPSTGFGPGTPLFGGGDFNAQFLGPAPRPLLPKRLRDDPSYHPPVLTPITRPRNLPGIAPGYYGGPMGVLGSIGGSILDPQGLGGLITQTVGGIYNVKAQTKMLKQLVKLRGLAGMVAPQAGIYGGVPAAMPTMFTGGGGGSSFNIPGLSLDLPSLPDIAGGVFGGISDAALSLGSSLLTPSPAARSRAPRLVGSVNNTTGRAVFYRYVGAPILFRGDLTTLKAARKAVSKFGGLAGGARRFRRRR